MRGTVASLPSKYYKFKQIYPASAGSWGITMTNSFLPKKQENNNVSGEGGPVSNERTDPIVAFSRPPPLPPVLGPLIAVSLFEMWSTDDDD